MIVALRSLFKYLSTYGLLVDKAGRPVLNPTLVLEVPDIAQKTNDWLREAEWEALRQTPMSGDEKFLVALLGYTGLRIGEARSLRVCDIDFAEGWVHVRVSKTARGIRSIPIPAELRPRLNEWLRVLEKRGVYSETGPLLSTRNRNQYAEKILRRVGDAAGIAGRLTPHRLRRTYGSRLLNGGARLEVVSSLLGHSSTQITEKAYAELSQQTIRREALAALGG